MTSSAQGRELFREQYWAPRRPAIVIVLYCQAVFWAIFLIGHPSRGSAIGGFVFMTLMPIGIGIAFEMGARHVWFVVGERTLTFGRVPPFPASAVRDFELLSGKRRIDKVRLQIRGRSTQWNMRTRPNPNLRGSLAPKGVDHAVLIHVDPAAARMETNTFLIGTRRPEELVSALREATGLAPTDSELVVASALAMPEAVPPAPS